MQISQPSWDETRAAGAPGPETPPTGSGWPGAPAGGATPAPQRPTGRGRGRRTFVAAVAGTAVLGLVAAAAVVVPRGGETQDPLLAAAVDLLDEVERYRYHAIATTTWEGGSAEDGPVADGPEVVSLTGEVEVGQRSHVIRVDEHAQQDLVDGDRAYQRGFDESDGDTGWYDVDALAGEFDATRAELVEPLVGDPRGLTELLATATDPEVRPDDAPDDGVATVAVDLHPGAGTAYAATNEGAGPTAELRLAADGEVVGFTVVLERDVADLGVRVTTLVVDRIQWGADVAVVPPAADELTPTDEAVTMLTTFHAIGVATGDGYSDPLAPFAGVDGLLDALEDEEARERGVDAELLGEVGFPLWEPAELPEGWARTPAWIEADPWGRSCLVVRTGYGPAGGGVATVTWDQADPACPWSTAPSAVPLETANGSGWWSSEGLGVVATPSTLIRVGGAIDHGQALALLGALRPLDVTTDPPATLVLPEPSTDPEPGPVGMGVLAPSDVVLVQPTALPAGWELAGADWDAQADPRCPVVRTWWVGPEPGDLLLWRQTTGGCITELLDVDRLDEPIEVPWGQAGRSADGHYGVVVTEDRAAFLVESSLTGAQLHAVVVAGRPVPFDPAAPPPATLVLPPG
jgi:hypothetical protein